MINNLSQLTKILTALDTDEIKQLESKIKNDLQQIESELRLKGYTFFVDHHGRTFFIKVRS